MKKVIVISALILGVFLVFFILLDQQVLWEQKSVTTPEVVSEASSTAVAEEAIDPESAPVALPRLTLATTTVSFADGTTASYQLAEPYELIIAAEGLGKARFMTMSPDGRLFVPDLVDYKLSHEGKLYVLDGFDAETGTFASTTVYLDNLRGPNNVAFYTDENDQTWLYLALTAHLVRYPYEPGDLEPSGEPEIIFEFPNTQAPEAKSVVWHITRTVHVKDDRLYVTVGSGCNSCEQPEGEMRGLLFSMSPTGEDQQIIAEGLRNAVDFTWAENELYLTENGADHLGANLPNEVMYNITPGEHYGWPYCYESEGEVVLDQTTAWTDPVDCAAVPESLTYFEARSAPLGIEYFSDFHPTLNGSFLVALHGSFEAALRKGNRIVRVTSEGDQEVFMDGFQLPLPSNERTARPLDILQYDDDSFFMSDDHGGRIFFVRVMD